MQQRKDVGRLLVVREAEGDVRDLRDSDKKQRMRELFRVDGQTDIMTLIVAFRQFENAPKNKFSTKNGPVSK